ncbi:antibiotic biosynthesis monooxygenase [Pelagibius sp.]|uniref:antibiotic biosynthesis monooxygenase family protein n=1 Tax=Pelagibius sp. TaxID=1931238 RepID=UPI00261A739B|nr:hypothetical protein [Pelagibius sp.]
MSGYTIEWASIRLAKGKTEADLLTASNTFQSEFLDRQPGFVRRELLRLQTGDYADVVHWRSMEDAAAIMEKAAGSPACQAYFAVMEMDSDDPAEGVEHHHSLAVYG